MRIIAEIGSNHAGSVYKALELIDLVAGAATDIKFQLFDPEKLYPHDSRLRSRAGMQAIPIEWLPILRDQAHDRGLGFGCSLFKEEDVEYVEGWDFLKLASRVYREECLHRSVEELGLPIVASLPANEPVTPWLDWHQESIRKGRLAVLVCSTQYPTALWDAGIRRIETLSWGDFVVGYSDHTMSLDIGGFAYCLGARVFEKHIRLPSEAYSPDGPGSLAPEDFFRYAQHIHNAADALRLPAPLRGELDRIVQ